MDIKSMKNNKEVKNNSPRTGYLIRIRLKNLMIFFCMALLLLGYTLAYRLIDYTSGYNTFTQEDYLEKEEFTVALRTNYVVNEEITRYAKNLNRFYIYHRDFKNTPDEERIRDEDIAQSIQLLEEDLRAQQDSSLTTLNSILFSVSPSEEEIERALSNFDAAMERINATYMAEVEAIRESAVKEIIYNYEGVESYLASTKEFTYYIKDSVVNRTFSNIKTGNINAYMNNDVYFVLDLADIEALFNGIPLNKSFAQNGIEGYIMVPYEQPANSFVQDEIYSILQYQEYTSENLKSRIINYSLSLSVVIIVFLLLIKSLFDLKNNHSIIIMDFRKYKKIPLTIKILSIFIAANYLKNFLQSPFSMLRYGTIDYLVAFMYLVILSFAGVILLYGIMYLIKLGRDIPAVKNEPEVQFTKKAFTDYIIMRRYSPYVLPCIAFLIISGSGALAFVAFVITVNNFYYNIFFLALPLIFIFVIGGAMISLKIIVNYAKLGYYINNLAEGNIVDVPPEKGIFTSSINKLNDINNGLKKTLDEMLKSERTKTELITNVSHDLKTPLTNIINYIELLKSLELPEQAKEYADILAQKAQRLKVLIEDLFEAAKLSSSSIELSYNRVDVVQLLEQTIGELSEKIERSQLDFRFSSSSEHIYILLDGQKMWRVFDNLLTNILKYTKKDTRVYISVTETEKTVEITMKNISAYELDFDASELFERFKRGDKSRTTEGSGLGLSIAQNIVNLHGGKLDISIDGDLFKSEIILFKNIGELPQIKGEIQ